MVDLTVLGRVAVLVVSYNTVDALRDCLQALARDQLEVVVVDNASDDGSVDMVRREFPGVHLLAGTENLGFGAGVNIAAQQTDRDYLMLLNPDCIIASDDLALLAMRMENDDRLGYVGPKILLQSGAVDHASLRADPDPLGAALYLSRLARLFPRSPRVNRYSLRHLDYDEEQELTAGQGAALMIRAEAFRAVGGFDEAFFMYGEDLDLCRRLRALGFTGRYVPSAVAHHLKGEASRKQSRRMLVEFHRSMWTYYRKHEMTRNPAPLNWTVAAAIGAVAAVRIGINAARRDKRVSQR